ncbi:MAG: arylamine N-acetyltransferase [Haloarculaceae archaeon]
MNADRYLGRIGVDPDAVGSPDRETLARLQGAHVRSVPFETLAITGDPYSDRGGEGVSLALPTLYEKIVANRRGGFCFELNGLFGWLLSELDYDVQRAAAQVLGDDGDPGVPANHLVSLVTIEDRYVVDVGLGVPKLRRPLALDGTVVEDAAGIAWRAVDSDRPDADYRIEARREDDWSGRYILDTTPRDRSYFEATCEYYATAPESHFTGDPVVTLATSDGHLKLSPGELVRQGPDGRETTPVDAGTWPDVLAREFGLRL